MISAPMVDTRFRVGKVAAVELAAAYGTPLYVLDEAGLRRRIREYRSAFESAYANCEIAYASKANSTLAVIAIAASEGCRIDVASEGELRAALAAGIPAGNCHFHGNNKSREELTFAIRMGIGQIIVDNFGEIETIDWIRNIGNESPAAPLDCVDPAALSLSEPARAPSDHFGQKKQTELVLRLAPGVNPITHSLISTGQADTKFGFNIADGSAERAVRRCLELGLPLIGFHCHVGSQLLDPEAQRAGGNALARFAASMLDRHGFAASYLNAGGGLGARYTDADRPMDVESYCRLIVQSMTKDLGRLRPTIAQEPGRALVAESGITLYRVGVVKTVPSPTVGTRTYVCVDGGLSDNPRPAMYGARYDVERVSGSCRDQMVTVSGRHCESDQLFEDVPLPADVAPGDLLQVLCTGAYNASMASNYNRYPRPATVLIREDGSHCLVQRRETWDEMLAREILPEGLA